MTLQSLSHDWGHGCGRESHLFPNQRAGREALHEEKATGVLALGQGRCIVKAWRRSQTQLDGE